MGLLGAAQVLHLDKEPQSSPRSCHPSWAGLAMAGLCSRALGSSGIPGGAATALPHLSLSCLFMGAVTGSGSVREVPAGGLIVGISEAQSRAGLPNAAGIKARSEMNKASSRGKNNSEGMERSRRKRGGAQSAVLSWARAQWWGSVPVPWGAANSPITALGSNTPRSALHPTRSAVLQGHSIS